MTKTVLRIEYVEYVMDTKAALKVFELLNSTTVYKCDTSFPKGPDGKHYDVKKVTRMEGGVQLFTMTDEEFSVRKLAGETKYE